MSRDTDVAAAAPSIWRSAIILTALAAVCTALVAFTYQGTRERIAANEQAWLERSLKPVLEGIDYEGQLSDSTLIIEPPHTLPGNGPATIYRVYADGEPIAALFVVTARDGYSGPIKLLAGIDSAGVLNRARVLEHRETPGLGDRIDSAKTDWIEQFNKRSLNNPLAELWAIAEDGGEFDALTGASISSRAVVGALRQTLEYHNANIESVYARSDSDSQEPDSDQ